MSLPNPIQRLALMVLAATASCGVLAAGVSVDKDWLTLPDTTLEIVAGSPLDFSGIFARQTSEPMKRVMADKNGRLTVAGHRQRFLCAPMIWTPPYGGFPSKDLSDRYAVQLRRAGYNLVRLMHVETMLMTGRTRDFDYDPKQLDLFHYFLFALKREGIYWMVDALSSENGSYGATPANRWEAKWDLKFRVFYDTEGRSHWRNQTLALFGQKNVYTGKAPLEDEALMGINVANEGGLQFLSYLKRSLPAPLREKLAGWLSTKYRARASDFSIIWKISLESIDGLSLPIPDLRDRSDPRMADIQAFFNDIQIETAAWMKSQLQAMGYSGLVTGYNNMPTIGADRARSAFPWIDMHYYHDESLSFQPGATIRNTSSFDDGLRMVTGLAMARQIGRPFTVSEYGQPFWNSWRREMIAVPVYAALHDWDAICQHASTAVDLSYTGNQGWKKFILPYAVGLDPVARVVETMSALLFRRGDVSESPHSVEVVVPSSAVDTATQMSGIDKKIAATALVVRTGLRIGAGVQPGEPTTSTTVIVDADNRLGRNIAKLATSLGISSLAEDTAGALARKFNPGNQTNSPKGLFQSTTGELSVDLPSRKLTVRTARSALALVDPGGPPLALGPLTVANVDIRALIAVASLDGAPLDSSKRLLLAIATDALNTGMEFTDASRRELVKLGELPVRIEPFFGKFASTRNIKITALSLSGKSLQELPVIDKQFVVAWRQQKIGATPYYLVEVTQ